MSAFTFWNYFLRKMTFVCFKMIEFIGSQVNLPVILEKMVVILVFSIYNKNPIGTNTSSYVCACEHRKWGKTHSESPLKNYYMIVKTLG